MGGAVPLSEYEQRVLDELAEQLRSDDPKLAETISGRAGRKPLFIGLGIVGLLGGLAALVGGSASGQLWLSAVGFVMMFAGVIVAMYRPKGQAQDASNVHPIRGGKPGSSGPGAPRSGSSSSFMNRLEERWEKRRREE